MVQLLRQSTEIKVRVGPVVAVGDAFTPVTTLNLGTADEAELLKADGAATVDISGATFAAVTGADGYYDLTLTTSLTDTVGTVDIAINDDSLCLPVRASFQVVEEAVFDFLYASGATPLADVNTEADTAISDAALATAAALATVDTVVDGIQNDLSNGTDGLGALKTLLDAIPTSNPTAAAIADQVWDEAQSGHVSAGSFGELAVEIAAILVDTNGLQSDDVPGTLSTIAGYIDTEVAAIKAATDTLGSPAGASHAADIAAIKAETASIEGKVDTLDTVADGIQSDLDNATDGLGALKTLIDALPSAADVNAQVDSAFTTQMADSVPADGAIPTREQAIYMINQFLMERAVSGTTLTVRKVDGSTALMTFTLNDADNPTEVTRAS